jgi:hypothetical protein
METILFRLTDSEKKRLDHDYPRTGKSATIGKRAVEIVKMYFRKNHQSCKFVKPEKGIDLHPVWGRSGAELEVKGTDSQDISWSKLAVSSKHSHDLLKKGLPLYRVTGVFTASPTIHIPQSGVHFEMKPELRWHLRKLNTNSATNRQVSKKSN